MLGYRGGLAAALAVAATFGPAARGAARTAEVRSHTLEYAGGGVTAGPGQSVKLRAGDTIGAVVFRGGPERYVAIRITDRHGLPVTGVVSQPDEADVHVCGATKRSLRINPFENVTVYVMNGACGAGGVSVATAGTVTATFSRR